MLTAADLQSGLGGKDAGVIDNLAIAKLRDAPAPIAMTVSLPKGSTLAAHGCAARGGMSFPWETRLLQGKTAACLSYSVFLPGDFPFGRGGALPGISGGDAEGRAADGFVARMAWRHGGSGGATLRVMSDGETRSTPADREGFAFPRGRWVKVEQEVVLNTPKQADGILRVWADGRLAMDRTDMTYRTQARCDPIRRGGRRVLRHRRGRRPRARGHQGVDHAVRGALVVNGRNGVRPLARSLANERYR